MFVWFEIPATIAKVKLDIHAVDMIKYASTRWSILLDNRNFIN